MARKDPLTAEHETLKRQTAQLARAHREGEQRGFRQAEHDAHRVKLLQKLAELRAHRERLQAARANSRRRTDQ